MDWNAFLDVWQGYPSQYSAALEFKVAGGPSRYNPEPSLPDVDEEKLLRQLPKTRYNRRAQTEKNPADAERASELSLDLLESLLRSPSRDNLASFFAFVFYIREYGNLGPTACELAARRWDSSSKHQAAELAEWIITTSPEYSLTFWFIPFLIFHPDTALRDDLLTTIGILEGHVLNAVWAIKKCADDPEAMIYHLAPYSYEWSAVTVIEELRSTQKPEIKHWILLEGWAHAGGMLCEAYFDILRASELHKNLDFPQISNDLFEAASRVIATAVEEGPPGPGLEDVAEGPQILHNFLRHATMRQSSWDPFNGEWDHYWTLQRIRAFLKQVSRLNNSKLKLVWSSDVCERLLETYQQLIDKAERF